MTRQEKFAVQVLLRYLTRRETPGDHARVCAQILAKRTATRVSDVRREEVREHWPAIARSIEAEPLETLTTPSKN